MFHKGQNLIYLLVVNLLYPAVLGSIFYSALGSASRHQWGLKEFSCLAMMLSVLVFYAIDYLYTCMHRKYTAFELCADLVLIFLMYCAFVSVNFLSGRTNVPAFSWAMSATFWIFSVWDLSKVTSIGAMSWWIVSYEIILTVIFASLAIWYHGYWLVAAWSVFASGVMVATFTGFYLEQKELASKT